MTNTFQDYLKEWGEVGFVERSLQSIIELSGLPGVALGETVLLETGQLAQVTFLDEDTVEALVLSPETIKVGTRASRIGKKLIVPVGEMLLGKTVNVLGRVIKGDSFINSPTDFRTVDITPGGIATRKKITRQMISGMVMTDLMVPIGKGQRELVIGDRKTGKSSLLLQSILSQARSGSICIYAAIGKSKAEIARVEQFFADQKITGQTILVAVSSQESAGEIYLSAYTAMTFAEYFRDKGKDVLLVLDDMTTHAKFYREFSLLSHKFPGRDSYPGDIFHVHSKLLERGGNFKIGQGEASITCLPVVETVQSDITGYIQTNLMSMTDGHIYFDSELFFRGRRPAINPFISVTRVGRQTQSKLSRDAGRVVLDLLNSYEKTQSFLKFGAELGENSRQILAMGDKVLKFFNQPIYSVVPMSVQMVLLALLLSGIWNGDNLEKMLAAYETQTSMKKQIDGMVDGCDNVSKIIEEVRKRAESLTGAFK